MCPGEEALPDGGTSGNDSAGEEPAELFGLWLQGSGRWEGCAPGAGPARSPDVIHLSLAFQHNGKITTTPEEQRFASAVVTDEAKEKVLRFLDLVSLEVGNHPVLAAEITLLLTHRLNIQLSESQKKIVEEARNQGLDSLELELLQLYPQGLVLRWLVLFLLEKLF